VGKALWNRDRSHFKALENGLRYQYNKAQKSIAKAQVQLAMADKEDSFKPRKTGENRRPWELERKVELLALAAVELANLNYKTR